ncbi:MAG: HEAT repeat domain-containing protein [Acidobacteria bacterium]|nr:HEAT repeat domain-containing protein [Acidobacteriota bacterium]
MGEEMAVNALLEALKDGDSNVRESASYDLGEIGGEVAVTALLEALKDEDTRVRRNAARALGEIGGEAAVAELLEALKDKDMVVREHAAKALGKIGGEAAVIALLEVWKDKISGHEIAVEVLGKIKFELLARGLLSAMSHENSFVRVRGRAAKMIGYYSGRRAAEELKRLARIQPSTIPVDYQLLRDTHPSILFGALLDEIEIADCVSVGILVWESNLQCDVGMNQESTHIATFQFWVSIMCSGIAQVFKCADSNTCITVEKKGLGHYVKEFGLVNVIIV